jgi:hypothetical protein
MHEFTSLRRHVREDLCAFVRSNETRTENRVRTRVRFMRYTPTHSANVFSTSPTNLPFTLAKVTRSSL